MAACCEREEEWECAVTDDVDWEGGESGTDVNDLVLGRHLGSGSFGRVVQCERRVGEPPYRAFALKIYSRARLRKHQQFGHDPRTGKMVMQGGEAKVAVEVVCGVANVNGAPRAARTKRA